MQNYLIVGAGFSGLYTAYRILQKNPDINIDIIESSDKIGGRVRTDKVNGHILEYGPMRFEPYLQPGFDKLIKELNITTKVFSPYTSPAISPDFNKITFDEIQAINNFDLQPAFALLKYGLMQILGEQWDVKNDNIHNINRNTNKIWLKKHGRFQGKYLYMYGLWDILAHVLSKEAIDYIQIKGSFYHILHMNPNAADQICFMLDILATAKDNLITIEGGTYELIQCIYNKILSYSNVKLYLNTSFIEIKPNMKPYAKCIILDKKLNIEKDGEYDHIFLTCHKKGLQKIKGINTRIQELLDTVMLCRLFKIFVIIENPPFNDITVPKANQYADKIPCREIHYSYNENTNTGLVMIYGDNPSLSYWNALIDPPNHTDLQNHITHYMKQIFPHYRGNIIHCDIMDWGVKPWETGVHFWKPKISSEEVIKDLHNIEKNIHICGETYSLMQGFIEGAIQSVDSLLPSISITNTKS